MRGEHTGLVQLRRESSPAVTRHGLGGAASKEAKALRAFTRTATVFASVTTTAGNRTNPSLSANPTPAVSGGDSREAAEQGRNSKRLRRLQADSTLLA